MDNGDGVSLAPLACPNCGYPLQTDEVYRAGYETDNNRTLTAFIGRGKYCDHIKAPEKK